MRDRICKKGLVIGIIMLFIETSVLPGICGNSSIINKNTDEKRNNNSILDSNKETEYYAIIVACSQYKNESHSLPPPPFPPIPEELFKQLYNSLLKADNWNASHITLLLNDDATKDNIIKAFTDLANIITPQDIFLFFWFGHGTNIPDEDGDEALFNPDDKYDEAICPYDTESVSDVLSDDDLDFYFSNINAKGMCLIFDCCLSGGLISKENNIQNNFKKGLSDDIIKENLHSCDVNGTNRIVIMNTLDNCVSGGIVLIFYWYGSPLMASFTDAFDCYAKDGNSDGFISIEEAFKSAKLSHIFKTNSYFIVFWITAVIFIKTGLWKWVYYVPIFKQIYSIPFIKKIVEYFYDTNTPIISATKLTLLLWIDMKYIARLQTGYPLVNWATMKDDYQGDLPIIKQ